MAVSMLIPVLTHALPQSAQAQGHVIECREMAVKYAASKSELLDRQVNVYLSQAAIKGCVVFAGELLKDGAAVNARRRHGDTPLHHAVKLAQSDLARLLLDAGADIEQRDLAGNTALTLAIEAGRMANVLLLLDRKASPVNPGKSSASPLAVAAYSGREKIVEILIGMKVDVNDRDNTGKTAIVYAAARGFTAIVRQILDAGVDPSAAYGNRLTALMWAAGHSNDTPVMDGVATIALLLERGAEINALDDRGWSALMTAADSGHKEIVTLLLGKGARRDFRDRDGKTALDLATGEARAVLFQ